jgi:hypothetical protein
MAADAPIIAGTSGSISGSTDITVAMTLHLVVEAVGEQRPDRSVDEPRGQRPSLGRPSRLKKPPGMRGRRRRFFPVIDGKREEVLSRLRMFGENEGDEHSRCRRVLASTAPPAWRAISPVSSVRVWRP